MNELEPPELASARLRLVETQGALGTAQDLAWPLAVLAGTVAHYEWHSWLVSIAVGAGAMWLAGVRYDRKHQAAERIFLAAQEAHIKRGEFWVRFGYVTDDDQHGDRLTPLGCSQVRIPPPASLPGHR